MLTLLTATGCRPDTWKICERLAKAQTYGGDVRWVIVDDGEIPQPINFSRHGWTLEVIRPEPFWKDGDNTQHRNLLAGLDVIGDDERVVVWEDDDYYDPSYLHFVNLWIDKHDLVGECRARYFNVQSGYGKRIPNRSHASLCSTAVKGPGLMALRLEVEAGNKFIDLSLWKRYRGAKKLYDSSLVVGIKGQPGRAGIGMGHTRLLHIPANNFLRREIGEKAAIYGY
jgi:hypothetical protein